MTSPKLIRRVLRFERNFTQLPNVWLRDESLSFRARGLLAMLMTHEHGWNVTLKAIAASTPTEGLDAMRGATRELEEAGYLKRIPLKGRGGQFLGDDWELCDPHDVGNMALIPALDKPTREATALDKPTRTALDKPTPIRTQEEHRNSSRGNQQSARAKLGACGHALVADRYCEFGCPPSAVIA